MAKVSESAANSLADPLTNPSLFPDMDVALQVEKMFLAQRESTKVSGVSAADYMVAKDDLDLNLIDLIKSRSGSASAASETVSASASAQEEKTLEGEMQALQIDPDEAAKKMAEEEAAAQAAAEAEALAAAAAAQQARIEMEAQRKAQEEAEALAKAERAAKAVALEMDDGDDFEDDW